MDEGAKVQVIFGRLEDDGSITELGRADPGDYVDPVVEIPGYSAAIRRGNNVSFHSDNEVLVAKLRKPKPERETGRERRGDGPTPVRGGGKADDKNESGD
jgi:hypothetical protein